MSSSNTPRKLSLTTKSMNVFRNLGKKGHSRASSAGASSLMSANSDVSPATTPTVKLLAELKPEPEPVVIAKSGEMYRTTFVSPFKFRPKRSSASATMTYTEKVLTIASSSKLPDVEPVQMPSPPPSPDRESIDIEPSSSSEHGHESGAVTEPVRTPKPRRKPFSSYLNLNLSIQSSIGPLSPRNSRHRKEPSTISSPLPSGSMSSKARGFVFSPASPFSPRTPRGAKTPKTPVPVPRTQPYGAPYYARMPTGETAAVESSNSPSTPTLDRSFSIKSTRRRLNARSPRRVSEPLDRVINLDSCESDVSSEDAVAMSDTGVIRSSRAMALSRKATSPRSRRGASESRVR